MKTKKIASKTSIINRMWLWMLAFITLITFGSCAHKVTFLTSSVVPAARGYVKVKKDKNNNYKIEVQLLYLAEVDRLEPAKETYIVWLVTDNEVIKNIGQVKSSTGFMSKELKGSFETVSAFKPSKIFITAEEFADTQMPGSKVVLTTERF